MEFSDLECPYCRRYHQDVLRPILKEFGDSVALVYIHMPIPGHRFARIAAGAAECAKAEGRFFDLVSAVFEKQDSLGLKPWAEYGADAGVRDTAEFARCVVGNASAPAIDVGLKLGKAEGVGGTPTILMSSGRYSRPPDVEELRGDIKRLLVTRAKAGEQ